MLAKKALEVYLNDHLAGSVAAIEIIDQSREQNEGTELAAFLDSLGAEIRADQEDLRRLMEKLEIGTSPVKQATTWVGEKFSRLKFLTTGGTRPELRSMQELEVIELGVQGKHGLWLALQQVADLDARLDGAELVRLRERSERQIADIEGRRLELAKLALSE